MSSLICFKYIIILFLFNILPVFGQDHEYVLDVNTLNCVANPDTDKSNSLYGSLPTSLVTDNVMLLSQPKLVNSDAPLEIVLIPDGAHVIVLNVDEQTQSYFRVVFSCEGYHLTGWVEASAIRHRVSRTNPKYAPPGCAQPLQVVTSLSDIWVSTIDGEVAIVVDLFRSEIGDRFPRSYLYLMKNGRVIYDTERAFESSGAFLIRSYMATITASVGDSIGFSVITDSDEELDFVGILYAVTDDCPLHPFIGYSFWDPSSESITEFIVVDQRELLGEVFTEQTGNVNNSTGTVPQDIAFRREFRHSIDLRLNQGANLDRQNVEQRILEAYDLPDQIGEKNCTILADVPAGAIHQYEIEWTQVLREGDIEEGSVPGQGNILGTYRIITDIECQRIAVHTVQGE